MHDIVKWGASYQVKGERQEWYEGGPTHAPCTSKAVVHSQYSPNCSLNILGLTTDCGRHARLALR